MMPTKMWIKINAFNLFWHQGKMPQRESQQFFSRLERARVILLSIQLTNCCLCKEPKVVLGNIFWIGTLPEKTTYFDGL